MSACSQRYVPCVRSLERAEQDRQWSYALCTPRPWRGRGSNGIARCTSLLQKAPIVEAHLADGRYSPSFWLSDLSHRASMHVRAWKLAWAYSPRLDIQSTGTSSAAHVSVFFTCMTTVSRCSNLWGALWGHAFSPAKPQSPP
jgi:hypothetical protein